MMVTIVVCKSIGRTTAMGLGLVWILVILRQTWQPPKHRNDSGGVSTAPLQQTTRLRTFHNNSNSNTSITVATTDPLYTCPNNTTNNNNATTRYDDDDDANADEPAYYAVANAPLREHWHDFVRDFRRPNSTYHYDGWGKNFAQVQSGMRDWKMAQWHNYFLAELADAARTNTRNPQPLRIYESAGGLGLNLLATTDILLQQAHDVIERVVIYGNEYMAESVDLAGRLYRQGVYADQVQWGAYCAADSRYLEFVPANAFDVVMTGYITPLQNPMQVSSADWLQYTLDHVCPNATQVDQMQHIQQTWYDTWITAMIRLAKPHGGHIWVEQVSPPLCDNNDDSDWGGVDRAFWTQRAAAWGVQVIAMADDNFLHPGRYHVALRKSN